MKGAAPDLSAATYQIYDETHTIGNALRWMLMKKYVWSSLFCPIPRLIRVEYQPKSRILRIQVNILPQFAAPSNGIGERQHPRTRSQLPCIFDSSFRLVPRRTDWSLLGICECQPCFVRGLIRYHVVQIPDRLTHLIR